MAYQGDRDATHIKSLKERLRAEVGVRSHNTHTGRSGQTTKQNCQDPGSTCHPARDKEERQAEPGSGERLSYASPEAGVKAALVRHGRSSTGRDRGHQPAAMSSTYITDLTTVIHSQ